MTDQFTSHTELDRQFDQLDTALSDPHVERILDQARTYNELLKNEEIDDSEAAKIIAELDAQWGTLLGMPMKISGFATFPNEDGEMVNEYRDDRTVVSNGFAIVNAGEDFAARTILLQLLQPIPQEKQTDSEGKYWIGYAEIDKVILDIPAASFERSIAWLSTFYPDLIDEMDLRTLNASGTEADSIMSLKGIELPEFSDEERAFAQQCIGAYLHGVIQLDVDMPYKCHIEGEVLVEDEQGNESLYVFSKKESLLFIHTIAPGVEVDDEESRGMLGLRAKMINADRLHPPVGVTVPLDSIKSLESMRSNFFDKVE